jgi:hypothetical protein
MSLNKMVNINGFSYEPENINLDQNVVIDYDAVDDESQNTSGLRDAYNISEWCKCGKCVPMLSQKESKCCHEVDEIKYHLLEGEC